MRWKEIRQFFERILKGMRDFSGNESVRITSSPDEKAQWILIEYWKTQEDFDSYLKWRKEIAGYSTLGNRA